MKAECTAVLLPRRVYETGIDKDIELEGILADYLPGINRVIRTEANLITEEVQINGNKAEVKGQAVFSLLYESDYKGKLKNERFTTDFTQRFDIGELPKGEYSPRAICKCSYVSCKTLSPRKLAFRCRGDIQLSIEGDGETQVVSVFNTDGAFYKCNEVAFKKKSPQIRKDFTLEEQFNIEGNPPVAEIIYSTLRLVPTEVEVNEGVAKVKCNGVYKCLYEEEGEEERLTLAEKRFSTVFTLDDADIDEDSVVTAQVQCKTVEAMKEQDNYGENRIFSVTAAVTVCATAYSDMNISLPADLFFEDYDCVAESKETVFDDIKLLPRYKFTVEKAVEVPDFPIDRCVDADGEINVTDIIAEDGKCQIKGVCGVNVLGLGEGKSNAHDLNLNFVEEIPLPESNGKCKIKAYAEAVNIDVKISGSTLNIKVSGELCCEQYQSTHIIAVCGAEITEREKADTDDTPIIAYYPDKGETAWEIGKRFHTDPDAIISDNGEAFDKSYAVAEKGTVIFM